MIKIILIDFEDDVVIKKCNKKITLIEKIEK